MSVKNFNGTIGNQSRDLPVCSTVPQPTAPSRAPSLYVVQEQNVDQLKVRDPKQCVSSVRRVFAESALPKDVCFAESALPEDVCFAESALPEDVCFAEPNCTK
jgi:hypothetical protein